MTLLPRSVVARLSVLALFLFALPVSAEAFPSQSDDPVTVTLELTSNLPDGVTVPFTVDPGSITSVKQWGSYGSGPLQFSDPRDLDITYDESGNVEYVYVVDRDNHRVVKFDANGNLLMSWGTYGTDPGQFRHPRAIAVDTTSTGEAAYVFVTDTGNRRIQKFDANGNFLGQWATSVTGASIYGLTVDKFGNVYATDDLRCLVLKFDRNLRFLKQWGSRGSKPGQFQSPYGIGASPDGTLFVTDYHNYRVQKFDLNGVYLGEWGSQGSGPGQFELPYGIAVDRGGNVYVGDYVLHRIQKFDQAGNLILEWGSKGSGAGSLSYATGIAIDYDGLVYLTEAANNRVQVFAQETTQITQGMPESVQLAPGNHVIAELAPRGWRLDDIDCTGGYVQQIANAARLSLTAGTAVTCTFDNSYHPPVFLSFTTSGAPQGAGAFAPSDIQSYDASLKAWRLVYKGSTLKTSANVSSLSMQEDGSILLSFIGAQTIANVGTVQPQDIVRFIPRLPGRYDAGRFELFFDGSDVGLTAASEKIDALEIDSDGALLISTNGAASVPGLSGQTIQTQDEDILAFDMTQTGQTTAGTWRMYFDGSLMPGMAVEDLNALAVDGNTGDLYITLTDPFVVSGVVGNGRDILKLAPDVTQPGGYRASIYLPGPTAGIPTTIDALDLTP